MKDGLGIRQKQILEILPNNEWLTTQQITQKVFSNSESAVSPNTIISFSLKRLERRGLIEGMKIKMALYKTRKKWVWRRINLEEARDD